MDAMEFQKALRRASDRLMTSRDVWHDEVAALFQRARLAAEEEPELFSAVAQAEQARLQRLMNEPIKPKAER